MTRSLPKNPDISLLKKQAKKLLRQFREEDSRTLALVKTYHPAPHTFGSLRDAHLVIARSYGFRQWQELREAIELARYADRSIADKAELFVQLGCVQYGGNDNLRNYRRANALLQAYPEIAEYDFYCALVANNASAVTGFLSSDATLARSRGGPLDWPPLVYSAYSRIVEPNDSQQSLLIVKLLLECGASCDSHIILNDTYRFTALTGAMGEGEGGIHHQPPHQYAVEMVEILLDAGANPNEGQGLYNTHFSDSIDKWLPRLLRGGLNADHLLNWDATGEDAQVKTLDYQLSVAVDTNCVERAVLLLSEGADPNARSTYNGRAIHTNALLAGHSEIKQLLEDKGAVVEKLDVKDTFRLACVNKNNETIATCLINYPELTKDSALLHAVAKDADIALLRTLFAHGFDINSQLENGRTLLHGFALSNDTDSIIKLLALGAKADVRDKVYNSTAAGFSAHNGSYDAMRVLLDASSSLIDCACCAYLKRAKALVEKKPELVFERTEQGNTLLHIIGYWLQDEPEYDTYASWVEWLVSAGLDIKAHNNQNQTPVEFHLANGFETLADIVADYS